MAVTADLREAHRRALAAAGHRLIEPLSAFGEAEASGGWAMLLSEKAEAAPVILPGAGGGNVAFAGYGSRAGKMRIRCSGSRNVVFVGAHARVGGDFTIRGDDTLIYIGAFTTVSSITVSQRGGGVFFIGDHGMLSARIFAGNSDEHSIYDLATGERINPDCDTRIDDHVWIARDVRIAKGARIGRDTLVGQGSFVSGALDSNSVYAGVPARKLRGGTTWSRTDERSLAEMEASARHRAFLVQLEELRARIASFTALEAAPAVPRPVEEAAV